MSDHRTDEGRWLEEGERREDALQVSVDGGAERTGERGSLGAHADAHVQTLAQSAPVQLTEDDLVSGEQVLREVQLMIDGARAEMARVMEWLPDVLRLAERAEKNTGQIGSVRQARDYLRCAVTEGEL